MNKKLYVIIQVLVIILAFFLSAVCAMHTTADLKNDPLETCTTAETLSAENEQATTETQLTDEPAPLNTQQTEEHQETESTQATEKSTEPPQTQPLETEAIPQETSQTQPSETEEVTQETQTYFNWYYAYNTEEVEILDENNEVIYSMRIFSVFSVLSVHENNPSLLYINYEGYIGYISDDDCIIEIPDVIELGCYFSRTLCELSLRDPEGELIDIIPVNSLVYVLGTPSDDYDRTTIINMCNGKVGTIARGNIQSVEDALFTSIDYQIVTLIIGGNIIARGLCVTGTKNFKDTPKGAYTITGMKENETLLGGKTCDYCLHFFDGCCFHDASWRTQFGGTIYCYNGSSGCVNCPYELAKTLYENCYIGIPVYVA